MSAKKIAAVLLLLFVAVSLVYLGLRTPPGGAAGSGEPGEEGAPHGVAVYYFHGNVRCTTCRTIEALTREALETGFREELREGRLVWRVVNVEDPESEHYAEEFALSSSSVVLERTAEGSRPEWKKLNRVWELVHGEKEEFLAYVREETRAYLEAPAR
ncbi:MAG: nitrophenyl compound nitroreductase subunit ArsF family protein [Bacteroidota bacterium]